MTTIVQCFECEKASVSEGIIALLRKISIIKSINVDRTAGRLKLFSSAWSKVTNDPVIRKWIGGYEIPFTLKPRQESIPSETAWSSFEHMTIKKQIS